ncbi:MAG: helix-turn-helix domain-containing protein [Butyrivibrio sp.]|nr:helix-turn-helix domain-containing protein [Butyrivibrio sp.]
MLRPMGENGMYKTLIIDDEQPVRIAISKLGRWDKYHLEKPEYAENGRDGLKALRELKPEIIFLDMQMPVMNGMEFLEKAQQDLENCAVIVISGYDDFCYTRSAVRNGAFDYLLKPVAEDELNAAIENAVKKLHPVENFCDLDNYTDSQKAEEVIGKIKDFIDSHYSEAIRLSDFAEQYFFSGEYLSKLFKLHYGANIYEYLQEVRMERAKELLTKSDLKVQDVAQRVGYSDTNYFSKAFRNYTGMTPKEWRSHHNK